MTAPLQTPRPLDAAPAAARPAAEVPSRRRWRDQPLGHRIGALAALAAGLSVAVATSATLALTAWAAERDERESNTTLARSIAFALQAPVAFMDERGLREAMAVLRVAPDIQGAWVYSQEGALLYAAGDLAPPDQTRSGGGLRQGWLRVTEDIAVPGGGAAAPGSQGRLLIQVSLADRLDDLRRQALAAALVALAGLGAGLVVARRLALRISRPARELAAAAAAIAADQRYDRRLAATGRDEIGRAVQAFNQMIEELQRRDAQLGQLHRQLQREAEDARSARAQAEAASQAKTRFLANMSHELRSPLNGVIGAAQLLHLQGADAQRREELVEIIRASGSSLLGLIESVLDLSRIEAGAMQVHEEDFNLLELVDAVLLASSASAATKGLRLVSVVDPALPPWRHGDGLRLRQLLLNLLGNAVKFTRDGEVRLTVRAGARSGTLSLEVADTGIGIPAEALQRIFEPFQQADVSTTRRFGGSGLGLTICRELARHLGGDLAVQSQPGTGTSFTLELPLPVAPDAPPAPLPLGLRVAWCEPHPSEAAATAALLERLGCEALRCDDPAQLRAAMAQPDRQGRLPWCLLAADEPRSRALLEACADWLPPERVIVVGGRSAGSAGGSGIERLPGLARALPRPLLRAALVSRLGRAFGLAPTPQEAAAPAAAHRTAHRAGTAALPGAPNDAGGNPARPRLLLVEDDPINQSVLRSMLEHAGWHCEIAGDGHQGLARLRERPYDLVLMDWQMPELDGLEATRRLRAGAAGAAARHLPVIALTANAFAEDRSACLAAGMNDFLTKPVQAALLIATVQRWLGHGGGTASAHSLAQDPARPVWSGGSDGNASPERADGQAAALPAGVPADTPPAPSAQTPADVGPLRSAVDFDPAVLAALPMVADGSDPGFAQELLAQFDTRLDALLDAIERARADPGGDALRRPLHTLKSSAAQVGALALAAEAARQEAALRAGQAPGPDALAQLQARAAAFRQARQQAPAAPARDALHERQDRTATATD